MNCPICKSKMQSEDASEVTPSTWSMFTATGKSVYMKVKILYRCDECDSEWIWTKGNPPTMVCLDKADRPL